MKTEFKSSFARDLRKIRDASLQKQLKEMLELIERVQSLQEIGDIKKLKGGDRYYRIRVGDYRMGLILDNDTVVFVRFLHRKDLYKYFP